MITFVARRLAIGMAQQTDPFIRRPRDRWFADSPLEVFLILLGNLTRRPSVDAKTIFATFVDPNNGQGGVLACRHSRPARVQLFLTAAAINFKRLARTFANNPRSPVRTRLSAGGNRIRTIGSA